MRRRPLPHHYGQAKAIHIGRETTWQKVDRFFDRWLPLILFLSVCLAAVVNSATYDPERDYKVATEFRP